MTVTTYAPRRVAFLGREGLLKHYGIALDGGAPRRELVDATAWAAASEIPDDAYGFTIAHDAATAALGLVYWWANENELHARLFAAPLDAPGRLEPYAGAGISCVWELEVIDFERRAWLEDVLKNDDPDRYLQHTLATVEV
jgi:hypothetical protein